MTYLHVPAGEIRRFDRLVDLDGIVYYVEPQLKSGRVLVRFDHTDGSPAERVLDASDEVAVERDGEPETLTDFDLVALLGRHIHTRMED